MKIFDFIFKRKAALKAEATTAPEVMGGLTRSSPQPFSSAKTRNWRESRCHLQLLSRFMKAGVVDKVAPDYWADVLKEPITDAIQRFVVEGLLHSAGTVARIEALYSVTGLKKFLKEKGLKVSGKKADLIDRLMIADENGMEAHVAEHFILECTPLGREVATAYLKARSAERECAEIAVLNALRSNEFTLAAREVAAFEAKQVFPRGMGVDWGRGMPTIFIRQLKLIFQAKPSILDALVEEEWPALRLAAGMMLLWGVRDAAKWLPDGFMGVQKFDNEVSIRMLMFHSRHLAELESNKDLDITTYTILTAGERACSACQKLGKRNWKITSLPELPYAKCTCASGCGCIALPDIKPRRVSAA